MCVCVCTQELYIVHIYIFIVYVCVCVCMCAEETNEKYCERLFPGKKRSFLESNVFTFCFTLRYS